jgi:hypothetical protein
VSIPDSHIDRGRFLKKLHVNMFESAVLDVLKYYPLKIYQCLGNKEFRNLVEEYQPNFEWCRSMLKVYFVEDDEKPENCPFTGPPSKQLAGLTGFQAASLFLQPSNLNPANGILTRQKSMLQQQ